MKKYPLIISAPHAVSKVSDEIKSRLLLTDYQIWKFSDPFTGETAKHPKAFLHNIVTTHRLMGDLSFGPKPLFPLRETDFYGNEVFKKDQKFTESEHEEFLENTAKPFRNNILKGITELEKLGFSKILLVDHHTIPLEKQALTCQSLRFAMAEQKILESPWIKKNLSVSLVLQNSYTLLIKPFIKNQDFPAKLIKFIR